MFIAIKYVHDGYMVEYASNDKTSVDSYIKSFGKNCQIGYTNRYVKRSWIITAGQFTLQPTAVKADIKTIRNWRY